VGVQIVIDHRHDLVFRLAVEVDQLDLALRGYGVVLEVAEADLRVAGRGFDHVHGHLPVAGL
jgi:hypothetical protein